mgnify:CR=1 FL=1
MILGWSPSPELSQEVKKAIEEVTLEEDILKRYKLALSYIEYFSAYLGCDKHSKFSLVCSQAAQDPKLFKDMEKKDGSCT